MDNKWFTRDVNKLKEKKKIYILAVSTNNETQWNNNKTIRNKYRSQLNYEEHKKISNKIDKPKGCGTTLKGLG